MVYEVRVKNPGGSESRFVIELEKALRPGDAIAQGTMGYEALRVLPGASSSNF